MNLTKHFKNKIFKSSILLTLVASTFFLLNTETVIAQSALDIAQNDRAALEAELLNLEAEIAKKQEELKHQQGQSVTLNNEITKLKTQIDKSKLDIKAKGLVIQKLGGEIAEKSQKIESLIEKIDRERDSLAQLIKKTNEIDSSNLIHVVLSDRSLSKFYIDLDSFSSIKASIKSSVDQIKGIKSETEGEKQNLEEKQDAELDAKALLERAKKQVEISQAEQKKLLSISKNKEAEFQSILAEQAKKAAQIKAKLFSLAGGGAAIPFGDALAYADFASTKTGVRPAFILAILTQESNLGQNQGKCYLSIPETGAGVRVTTGAILQKVMKPSRDVAPFLEITKSLGLDPYKTVVSCPLSGGGYGGAMGPSQFIASTWNILKSRIASAIGSTVANPWAPKDAITASAIYLGDLGANIQNYTAERNAACRYYSGRRCDNKKPANSFYGNSVMSLANKIQDDIDYLKKYGVSKR